MSSITSPVPNKSNLSLRGYPEAKKGASFNRGGLPFLIGLKRSIEYLLLWHPDKTDQLIRQGHRVFLPKADRPAG